MLNLKMTKILRRIVETKNKKNLFSVSENATQNPTNVFVKKKTPSPAFKGKKCASQF
jgi:hypothetical protein